MKISIQRILSSVSVLTVCVLANMGICTSAYTIPLNINNEQNSIKCLQNSN
ncbi:MAG: hypothetical protein LUB59_06565 [Candidatus Gastranaerophilales bacterium]|nr:hypothetical protein [Candidatus Gastranaerophilales bacterium]